MKPLSLFTAVSLVVLVGCSSEDDAAPVATVEPSTQSVAFEGKNDPVFVGTWASDDGRSKMTLGADGASRIESSIVTPGGAQSGDTKGQWKSTDGNLLIQSDKGETVLYYATMKGKDTMELRRVKGSRIKTVFKKKS